MHFLRNVLIVVAVASVAAALSYPLFFQAHHSASVSLPPYVGRYALVSQKPLISGGKPVFLFIGSEACPYCAAESWAIVSALSSVGSWEGLAPIISNATDSIPSVPGYTFANASLSSSSLVLWEVELNTRSWAQYLQQPNQTELALWQKLDPNGIIPFILIGGMYLGLGTFINPSLEENAQWNAVYSSVQNETGQFALQVHSEAENITSVLAVIHRATADAPHLSSGGLLLIQKNAEVAAVQFSRTALASLFQQCHFPCSL